MRVKFDLYDTVIFSIRQVFAYDLTNVEKEMIQETPTTQYCTENSTKKKQEKKSLVVNYKIQK